MGRAEEDTERDAHKACGQGHDHGQASKFPLSSRPRPDHWEPIGHLEWIQLSAQRRRESRL
jgi:hypothetical protein